MIKFLQAKILHFIYNKRAVSLAMFAGFAMIGTTVAITTVNINDNNKIKAALQALADQSVLSAQAIKDKTIRPSECQEFFNNGIANNPDINNKVTINSLVCNNIVANAISLIELKGNITIKSSLGGGTFGVGDQTFALYAMAANESRKIELVYALSTQGTMCATITDNNGDISVTKDQTCRKFKVIKNAIDSSITELSNTFSAGQLTIGVVPYNYKVKFPDLTKIPGSLTALENETNFFTQFTNEEPLAEITPLTNDYDLVQANVAAMTLTPEAISWGRSDIGMHVAGLMLEPSQKQFFSNHRVNDWAIDDFKLNTSSTENQKYIILMADAINMGCCFTNNPSDNFNNQYVYNYTPYNNHMLKVCDALKAKKVTIFTILLNSDGVPAAVGEIADNLMARCASGTYQTPSLEGNPNNKLKCHLKTGCYNVSTNQETSAVFSHITQRILKPGLIE